MSKHLLVGRRLAAAALAARLGVTVLTGIGYADCLPDALNTAGDVAEQAYDQHEWREQETLTLDTEAARNGVHTFVLVK